MESKGRKLVVDIAILPDGLTATDWLRWYKEFDIAWIDSSKVDREFNRYPYVLEGEVEVEFRDYSTITEEELNKFKTK